MKRISVAHRFKDRALVASLVRGIAFALITLLFTTVAFFKGFLWCIYIGFSLTMAFGAKKCEYKNYVCSLTGYVVARLCILSSFYGKDNSYSFLRRNDRQRTDPNFPAAVCASQISPQHLAE